MTLSVGSPKLTTKTKRAIAKYGEAVCKESFSVNYPHQFLAEMEGACREICKPG